MCRKCRQRPKAEQQCILARDEVLGFVEQRNISKKNIQRLETLSAIDDAEFQKVRALVLEIARVKPHKRRRWKFLHEHHPGLLRRAAEAGFLEDVGGFEPMMGWLELNDRYKSRLASKGDTTMAIRIGEYIRGGEIYHRRQNSVCGWLDLGNDEGLKIELTGNLPGQLCRKSFRFEVAETQPCDDQVRQLLDNMEMRQIGAVGDLVLRIAKVPDCSMEEFRCRLEASEPIEYLEQPCLYFEWFGQNGRVVAEVVNPKIEFLNDDDEVEASAVQPEALPDAEDVSEQTGPQIIGFAQNEHGFVEEFSFDASADDDDCDDPYGLFPEDLERQLASSGDSGGAADSNTDVPADTQPRDWADVIPGIDPETKAMYEQWDEILHGTDHNPVATLFDPPLALPPAAGLTEAEGWQHLNAVLARLAEFCVAIDMCEHATGLNTYRWLVEEILPEARFTPASIGSGFVQHYSTFDNCPQCDAEFEAEWAAREAEKQSDADDGSVDTPDDLPF